MPTFSFRRAALITLVASLTLLSPSSVSALSSHTFSITPATLDSYTTTGFLALSDDTATASWYHQDWTHRYQVTIFDDWIEDTLTDFPVLLRLPGDIKGTLRSDLHDLVITSGDGTTKLAHEVEGPDAIWVRVPTLNPDTDTTLYIYTHNPEVTQDQANPSHVWSNGYVGVWHLSEDPAEEVNNTTGTPLPLTNAGSLHSGSAVGTKIDKGTSFTNNCTSGGCTSGNSFLEENSNSASLRFGSDQDFTYSIWLKTTATQSQYYHVVMGNQQSGRPASRLLVDGRDNAGKIYFQVLAGGSSGGVNGSIKSTTEVDDGQWHLVTGRRSGATLKIFVDGSEEASTTVSSNPNLATAEKFRLASDFNRFFQYGGLLDEARISSTARSAAWIGAEHANQCECEDFLSYRTTPETLDTDTSATITPKNPLSFDSLSAFTANSGGTTTFQLSNDNGKSWYFYGRAARQDGGQAAPAAWKQANPDNPNHRSSINDIAGHITSFPTGQGQLLWRAYLDPGATLDDVTFVYLASSAKPSTTTITSLTHPLIQSINSLYRQATQAEITPEKWTYWAKRILSGDKTTFPELLGAMEWHRLSN